jgi:hypothetical protein
MKNATTVCKTILITGLAVAVLAWLPSPAQAQGKQGANLLKKVQTVEDVQQIEAGDTIVMSCPKCKDTYVQVVEKSWHAATPDQLKTVGVHLCSSCDTKLVTKVVDKQAKETLVHTCKVCGSEDVSCCLMKKGSGSTSGMEQK